ncbi:MAG: S8 family serine peptidase [Actinobacteria bacterium]|nr:S8 family serine peptidase [Actinomycetota bacterium]
MVGALAVVAPTPAAAAGGGSLVDAVVTLDAPPLAQSVASSRTLSSAQKTRRLDLHSTSSVSYLRSLAIARKQVERRVARDIPGAILRWRYSVVVNGFAIAVPAQALPRLRAIPGVARVYPSVRYHSLLDRSPEIIGAPALWGPTFSTAGNGMKIAVVDDGVDQRHPFFSAQGFTTPAGFPKGQAAFTTAKVIAARAFPPRSPRWTNASRPFDPEESQHATHVAGIAAGDRLASAAGRSNVSGVAPNAYIGNYKVLTIPTDANVGLDGNAPEIVAGIEAAVRDGMDVLNLSLGEPEVEPQRDIVVQAINAAADAGVIPAIAAGNDFSEFGRGSVGSPGSAAKAITSAAVTKARRIADFSSSGPTPISLQMKPDVSAPGVSILSSIPPPELWANFSGTSMAAPHVAGAAAILRQRHPTWTVAQVKSALVLTGDPVYSDAGNTAELPATRQGGGLINLRRADSPLVFADPTSLSFGFLQTGQAATRSVALTDAGGGGGGAWAVSVQHQSTGTATVTTGPSTAVPGTLELRATAAPGAQGEVTGFVLLKRGPETRRLPFWLRVTDPALGRARRTTLSRTGTYRGNTRGRQALVDTYRYPDNPSGAGVRSSLRGPEHVFRVRLGRAVENFGVAILSRAAGVQVEPRVVVAGDENRLTGYAGLPLNLNPYTTQFFSPALVAGALRPAAGSYDLVFDSMDSATAGAFTFRFWLNDQTPPRVRLLPRSATRRGVSVLVTDRGSGVNPTLMRATIDGNFATVRYSRATGRAVVTASQTLGRGRHQLVFRASDYQETKNNENVLRILPNTRRVTARFTVR